MEEERQPAPQLDVIYNRMVDWYTALNQFWHSTLTGIGLAVSLLGGFVLARLPDATVRKLVGDTDSPIEGYKYYTPTFWLVGLIIGLLTGFVLRYSQHPRVSKETTKAARWIEKLTLNPAVQYLIVTITLIALVVEILGLTHPNPQFRFTISAFTRDFAIHHIWLYWVGGILTGAFLGALVDLNIPKIPRLMMVFWVAVFAHIFWWITLLTKVESIKGTPDEVIAQLKDGKFAGRRILVTIDPTEAAKSQDGKQGNAP